MPLVIRQHDLTYYRGGWFFHLRRDEGQQCMTLDVSLGFSRSMTFIVREDENIMHGARFLTRLTPDGAAFRIECPDCLITAAQQPSAAA